MQPNLSDLNHHCPLCCHQGSLFYQHKSQIYYQCPHCHGIFLEKSLRLDSNSEKQRYLKHQNDVDDAGYLDFISPITLTVLRDYNIEQTGLDFGCGYSKVISHVLAANQFNIASYDPIFANDPTY